MHQDLRYRHQSLALKLTLLAVLLLSACRAGTMAQTKATPSPPAAPQIYIETSKSEPMTSNHASPQLYAIDAATGAQTWHTQLGESASPAIIAGNIAYLITNTFSFSNGKTTDMPSAVTGHVYELATANGQVLRKQDTAGSSYQNLFVSGDVVIGLLTKLDLGTRTPPITGSPEVVGLRSSDLTPLWQIMPQNTGMLQMAVSGTTVFTAIDDAQKLPITDAGKLRGITFTAYDAKTGNQRWQQHVNLILGGDSVVVTENTLYVSSPAQTLSGGFSPDRLITAFDAATGRQIWQSTIAGGGELVTANASSVFVGLTAYSEQAKIQGGLEALNARDGTISWHAPLYLDESDAGPWIVNGNALYGVSIPPTNPGDKPPSIPTVFAVDAHSGHTIWTVPLTIQTSALYPGSLSVAVSATAVHVRMLSYTASGSPTSQISAFKRDDGTLVWKYPAQDFIDWLVTD